MKKIFCSALFCSALFGMSTIQAAVIDFDSDPSFHYGMISPYEEDGFQVHFFDPEGALFWGTDWKNADPGGNTITNNGPEMLISKADGGLFDLISIDLADVANVGNQGDLWGLVWFDFVFGNPPAIHTISHIVYLDELAGLQTATFNYQGLLQVSILFSTQAQLDNIVVNSSLMPVPVPATVWLFGSGLVGLLGFNRKRSQSTLYSKY